MPARRKHAEDAARIFPNEARAFHHMATYQTDVNMEEVLAFRRQLGENIGVYAESALFAVFDRHNLYNTPGSTNSTRAVQILARLKHAEDAACIFPNEARAFHQLAIYFPQVDMEDVLAFRRSLGEDIGIHATDALWAAFDKQHLVPQAACASAASSAAAASASAVLDEMAE